MKLRAGRLAAIAGVLVFAASLKLVEAFGDARAQNSPTGGTPDSAQTGALAGAVMAASSAPRGTGTGGANPLDAEFLVELRQREVRLAEREAELAERMTELARLEARIGTQLRALQEAEQALAATMALADQAAETDLVRLTSLFEAMRPEQAAAVVSEMAPEFAAGLIGRLQPATAATIMAGLEPRFAYGLAAILAGRNAEVPRRVEP